MVDYGKVEKRLVVVTGAGSGIGRAIAKRMAATKHKVLLIGRRGDKLSETASYILDNVEAADVDILQADLGEPDSASSLTNYIESRQIKVQAIICAAGAGPVHQQGGIPSIFNEWEDAWRSNVMTAVLAVESLEHSLVDHGSVVLFSSIAAYRGSGGTGAYGAAKAAIHSYVHTLANRLGQRGINVNAIAPGYIAETEFFGDRLTDTRRETLIRQTALQRPGYPSDVAELSFFLCSQQGSYVTSQIIQVNGGSNHGV